jgi:hypothetical protein
VTHGSEVVPFDVNSPDIWVSVGTLVREVEKMVDGLICRHIFLAARMND